MKRPRYLLRISIAIPRLLLLFSFVLLSSAPGILSSRLVTLGSIEIFKTHEWLPSKPTVYFHCQGENKTILPDVKKTHVLYTFKGEESWQPLTELPDKKCKRCGIYEKDNLKPDDVYDEWELCADDFVDGKYIHFKDNEFNATFICPGCTASTGSTHTSASNTRSSAKKSHVLLVIVICILASLLMTIGAVAAYKYWQKRKREQDQARFLKLFEEGDDFEEELGLGHVI
ncbi:hypothetical protein ACMD2_01494 [Ananas comosus]|uniref:DUF7953 domain-containing protein n=1 Tax=Ananas comosus TaxID=4615 RepID=A0A199VB80_ANACO|nr:hypothetical protein ACMD2_01494 [Ananas comosus]